MNDSFKLQRWFTTDGPALLTQLKITRCTPVADFGCGVGSLAIPRKHFEEDEGFSFAKVTPFQRGVYRTLQTVSAGNVTTYGRLAKAVGCRSAQAVGQALRRNPCAPRVPCHRVIAADGSLGGFGGAADAAAKRKKQSQLEAEGVFFDERGYVSDPGRIVTPRSDLAQNDSWNET